MQESSNLLIRISRLTLTQQEILEVFLQRLESAPVKSNLTLDEAVDEFEQEHPELLRLLAQ